MYFPYLRGKQYEVSALRELASLLVRSQKITPIFEPVRRGRGDNGLNHIARIASAGAPLIIIENPERGDFRGDEGPIRRLFAGPLAQAHGAIPGYIASARTSTTQLEQFVAQHANRLVAFVHLGSVPDPDALQRLQERSGNTAYNVFLEGRSGRRYITGFGEVEAVLLEDPFERRARNQDYPPREFFSDLHSRYQGEGFEGFGDFLIVGNHYTEGGGAAHAVAIHLTNREGAGEVWIRHFISDRTQGTADTPGKFLEALRKTVRFIRSDENWRLTEGCGEFISLNDRQHFPNLGFVKKISMKHHLELMNEILSATD